MSDKTGVDDLERRKFIYERFLKAICKSEVLKSCQYLVFFLKLDEKSAFEAATKSMTNTKFSRKIGDVVC